MPGDQTAYDLFISYARKDNKPIPECYPHGWVTAIRDHIAADHRQFSTAPLRIFLDTEEIVDADDWRFRILGALKHSKMLLVCLSPNYFASPYCRWEWEEYLKRQVHQLMGSESVATVYFVEVPGIDEQENARWLEEILHGNFTDLRPWFPDGAEALQKEDVRARMAVLGGSLWERLQRARRAMGVPGNLRWQNPHFVGRREELRKLHEQLGTGAVGVVTAVHGLGGQGKTELAVAYAHGWADCYPAGLWSLQAEGEKELLPLIGELAWERALEFSPSEAEKNDPALLGRGVLEHLKARAEVVRETDPDQGAAALLLLDNVSEPELLSPGQLATLPGGMGAVWLRVVATTRLELPSAKDRLSLLPVDALDEDSALSLIRDHQPPRDAQHHIVADLSEGEPEFESADEEEAARRIVRALGGFTLAVEQVALYLGLHPDVPPGNFLATLEQRGIPLADCLPARDEDVAARMLTQCKQLGLILDATLARLDEAACTALHFAALLPPDMVPWPWLRTLTVERHPELGEKDDLGADPWLSVQRRLSGLRLLTPGDHPEVARIHRLVAAHLESEPGVTPVDETASQSTRPPTVASLDAFLGRRADALYEALAPPSGWELDALIVALPIRLADNAAHGLARDAIFLVEKLLCYRNLPVAADFLSSAHAVIVQHAERDPSNAGWQRDLSVSYSRIGEVRRAQGDLAGALVAFRQSMAIRERLAQSDPSNADWQRDLGSSCCFLGMVFQEQGKLDEALAEYLRYRDVMERLAQSDPSDADWQRDLGSSHCFVGIVFWEQGKLAEALAEYRLYCDVMERLVQRDPSNADWQRDLSVSYNKIGEVLRVQGDLAGALVAFRQSMTVAERLAQSDPSNADWQRDLSVSHNKIGDMLHAQGDLTGALVAFRQSMALREPLAQSDSSNADWQRDMSVSHNKIGDVLRAQGDLTGALVAFRQSMALRERLAQSDPSNAGWQRDLAVSHQRLAFIARENGDKVSYVYGMRNCLAVLNNMKRRGLHFDPELARIYEQLAKWLGS